MLDMRVMIALAAAQAWTVTAATIRNPTGDDEQARLARHREAVVSATGAIVATLLDRQT
jgi:hypothetical protein